MPMSMMTMMMSFYNFYMTELSSIVYYFGKRKIKKNHNFSTETRAMPEVASKTIEPKRTANKKEKAQKQAN